MINELENTSKRKDEIECIVENLYCYLGYKPLRVKYNDFFSIIISKYINEVGKFNKGVPSKVRFFWAHWYFCFISWLKKVVGFGTKF